VGLTRGQPAEHISDRNPHIADAGTAAALARLDRDDVLVVHAPLLASFLARRSTRLARESVQAPAAAAPIGALLPSGLKRQPRRRPRGLRPLPPNGCVAEVIMDDKLLGQLKNAKTATFIIFETPEEGIGFPLSLNGLAEGFEKLP
jgi:invasion protein IalB